MIRQLLQLAGAVCLTAGAVLYYTEGFPSAGQPDVQELRAENGELKHQLAETKEALADAQKATHAENTASKGKTEGNTEADKQEEDRPDQPVTKMVLSLSSGDSSRDASDALEKSGIIESASEFEKYLDSKGLSSKIQIGRHAVDSSMDFSRLAEELTTVRQ